MKKLIFFGLLALMLVGCKPTEKNYRNAYEIAMNKKKAVADDYGLEVGELQSVEGARKQAVGEDFVWILPDMVKPQQDDKKGGEGQLAVVVSKFNMGANAKSQAAALASEWPDAVVCIDGRDHFFVSIARCNELSEALDIIKEFQAAHPDYPFVGLDGHPCVVRIR